MKEISLKTYENFVRQLYKGEKHIENRLSVVRLVSLKSFRGNSFQKFVGIYDNNILHCVALIIIHKNAPEQMTISFFEALPQSENPVSRLIHYCEKLGKQRAITNIVVGMNGHCNNGLGFTLDDEEHSFGEYKVPIYYHDYFKEFEKIDLVSFVGKMDSVRVKLSKDMELLENYKDIRLEYADFGVKGFKNTLKRYTELNNAIFNEHRYYFKREHEEDYELFKEMAPLLKNESLIFAKDGNKDIGFILWYPDFNELADKKGVGAITFIKYRLLKQKIKRAKVVEIGVVSNYQKRGVTIMLLNKALNSVREDTKEIISSWILEANRNSTLITKRYCPKLHKRYCYYEKRI